MSDDDASFEVILRDGVSRKASTVAAGFKKVHSAAEATSASVDRGTKALRDQERQLKETARSERAYAKQNARDARRSIAAAARSEKIVRRQRLAQARESAARRTQQRERMVGAAGTVAGGAMVAGGAAAAAGGFVAYQTTAATLSAVKYRDEVLTGLKLITGSASEANRVFKESVALSDKLGLGWEDTVGGMQKLLSKGFDEGFATDLTKGVADLKIVSPDANIGNLLLAIGQIKTAGKLQGDELNQLTEAGLNSSLMFDQLQKRLGKSREEVLKLKEGGKLLAGDVLPAILDSIKQLTGKELGQAASEAVDSTAGRMRKLEQLPGRFFLAVANDLESSPLDGALANLLKTFDPDSEAFAKGVEFVSDTVVGIAETLDSVLPAAKEFGMAFADAFMAFEGIEGEGYKTIAEMFKDPKTIESIRMWGDLLGNIAAALTQIAKLAGFGAAMLPSVVSEAPKAVADYGASTGGHWSAQGGEQASASGSMIGDLMAHGFWSRLFGGTEMARAGGVALANAAEEGMRSREGADIHSPSKKTAKVGAYMTGGLLGSFEAGMGDLETAGRDLGRAPVRGIASGMGLSANAGVQGGAGASLGASPLRSTASRLPEVSAGAGVSAGASAGSSVTMGNITIPISGLDQETMKNPEAIARAVRLELQRFFDGLSAQGTIQTDDD